MAADQGPYGNIRCVLGQIDLSPAQGARVLLKPNAGRMAQPELGVTTHPQALAALIDAFREVNAEVAIGESPISGVNTLAAFETTGIATVARERNCPLIDLDAKPAISLSLPEGQATNALRVCTDVLEYDIVVSVPVMKMHMHTMVSMALKNMKGCLWRRSKVQFHMLPPVPGSDEKSIDIAIADMSVALRPHLSVVDGYVAMAGLGPSAGDPHTLDVAVAGVDPFAVDSIACELMGLHAADVPHIRLGAQRLGRPFDPAALQVVPADWRRLVQFVPRPPEDLAIEFPNITVRDKNSCSACQSTLLLFLKRYGDQIFDYFPPGSCVSFAIGKGNADLPAGTVCIGNCTARHKGRGVFVPGCPPVASEILTALSGEQRTDVLDGQSRTQTDQA